MVYYGTLNIFCYVAKNKTKYKMTFYNGKYHFVHISRELLSNCVPCKTKNHKDYYKYTGQFILNDNDTIDIY